jgi:hypothetical protein
MKKLLFVFAFFAFITHESYSQYYIGVKGGIGLNMQKWNSYERDILFSPCIDFFSETNDDELNKLYVSAGFHTRGSGVRSFGLGFNSFRPYKFNNLSFEVGGKRMVTTDKKYNGYYLLGLRAEYTMSTNLDGAGNSIYNLVSDVYVRKFNYGVSVGGGFELEIARDKVVFFELVVQPDLSKQYEQLETLTIENPNPVPGGPYPSPQFITIVPQEVRNVALELKVGIKLLRAYLEYDE